MTALRDLAFRAGLRLGHAAFGPHGEPTDLRDHAVLQATSEWQLARDRARHLGLPRHPDPPRPGTPCSPSRRCCAFVTLQPR